MDSWQVLAVMDLLAVEGVIGWIDGGWGVDALLGEQTRPHADLDLAVDEKAVNRLVQRLRNEGYSILRDELPASIALRHDNGREVDLHPGGRQSRGEWRLSCGDTRLAVRVRARPGW